jgi:hypothetical protein
MKFKEYAVEVQRTCPSLDDFHLLSAPGTHTLPQKLLDTVHMRLGMISEVEELMEAIHKKDKVGVGEELTDILWYAANDIRIKLKRQHIDKGSMENLFNYNFGIGLQVTDGGYMTTAEGINAQFNALVFNISKLCDFTKKNLAYSKAEPDTYVKNMTYLLGAVNNLAYHLKINLELTMDSNIAKLKKRYADKFTIEEAVNRDLVKEREILEKGAGDDYPIEPQAQQ